MEFEMKLKLFLMILCSINYDCVSSKWNANNLKCIKYFSYQNFEFINQKKNKTKMHPF